ncbi:MAG TPA: hypothetical protein VM537_17515 [Anaerolineae bacterium]|nr:hypothetical protein [Anaerolineae bacterium]
MPDMIREPKTPDDPVMSLVLGMLRETRDDVKAIREQMNISNVADAARSGGFTVRLESLEDRHKATRNLTYALIVGLVAAYFRELLRHG